MKLGLQGISIIFASGGKDISFFEPHTALYISLLS